MKKTCVNDKSYDLTFDKWCWAWGLTSKVGQKGKNIKIDVWSEDQPIGNVWAVGQSKEEVQNLLIKQYGSLPEWWCNESEQEYLEELKENNG